MNPIKTFGPNNAGSMNFQLVLIKPNGFDFVESFREVMEAIQWGLQQLGHDAPIRTNTIAPDATPIVFGAHHLVRESVSLLPPPSIIYNLEQLMPGYPWYQPHYLDILKRFRVWDGDLQSTEWLRKSGIASSAIHVPVAYAPPLSRIAVRPDQDVDVLFYGVQTMRRQQILRALADSGLRVVVLNNVWGKKRDDWIARTRVVLNMHQQQGGRLEAARLIYLIANGVPVVSEVDNLATVEPNLAGAFMAARFDDLVSSCVMLAGRIDLRSQLAEAGKAAALSPHFDASRIVAGAIAATSSIADRCSL